MYELTFNKVEDFMLLRILREDRVVMRLDQVLAISYSDSLEVAVWVLLVIYNFLFANFVVKQGPHSDADLDGLVLLLVLDVFGLNEGGIHTDVQRGLGMLYAVVGLASWTVIDAVHL